jgi:hypothetical protein
VTENLTKSLIDLRGFGLASQGDFKLRLDHVKRGFDVRPLVIALHESFGVEVKQVIHLLPNRRVPLPAVVTGTVGLERNIWLRVMAYHYLQILLMCGVKTNIVTAVEITNRLDADSPQFKQLVDTTAANFVMQEVLADKAYLSAANLQTVIDHAAMPYIPFKANSASD